MLPRKMSRREFNKYLGTAAAAIFLGCASKNGNSNVQGKISGATSTTTPYPASTPQNDYENFWGPGIDKVTADNFYDVDPSKYPQWEHGKEVYRVGEKLMRVYTDEAGKGYSDLNDMRNILSVSGRPEIIDVLIKNKKGKDLLVYDPDESILTRQIYLFDFIIFPSTVSVLTYAVLTGLLTTSREELEKNKNLYERYIPFSDIIYKDIVPRIAKKIGEKENKSDILSKKYNADWVKSELNSKPFIWQDPRKFKITEEIENITREYLYKKGFDNTVDIWLGEWAELGKKEGLKGFFIQGDDVKNREREVLVISEAVLKRAKDIDEEVLGYDNYRFFELVQKFIIKLDKEGH